LIDFSKRREPAHSRIPAWFTQGELLAVCAIIVTEFFTGIDPADRADWDQFFSTLHDWDVSPTAARQAGIWRFEFARRDIQLSTPDTLIAAVAHERAAAIVTCNVQDFPMSGVQLLSLRP